MITLKDDAIHLWHIDAATVDAGRLRETCSDWLSDVERSRMARLVTAQLRLRFLLGRFLLRATLSRYAGVAPADWRFVENEYGKPAIAAGQCQGPLYFNLSHSDDWLVLAVSRQEFLGVDIEASMKVRRIEAIASRYFAHAEVEQLMSLSPQAQQDRFYDLWTLKEAYIKARGMGLAIPLESFSFAFSAAEESWLGFSPAADDERGNWQFWQLDPGREGRLALAVSSTGLPVSVIETLCYHDLERIEAATTTVVRQFKPAVPPP